MRNPSTQLKRQFVVSKLSVSFTLRIGRKFHVSQQVSYNGISDPNEYINAAVSKNSSQRAARATDGNDAYAERQSARPRSYNYAAENDSDSGGSILMRETGAQVKADSPNSSGIVADMDEGRQVCTLAR